MGGIGVGGFGVFLGSNIPGSTKKKIHKKNRQLCVQCMMGARRLAALNLVYRLRLPPPWKNEQERGGGGVKRAFLFLQSDSSRREKPSRVWVGSARLRQRELKINSSAAFGESQQRDSGPRALSRGLTPGVRGSCALWRPLQVTPIDPLSLV